MWVEMKTGCPIFCITKELENFSILYVCIYQLTSNLLSAPELFKKLAN